MKRITNYADANRSYRDRVEELSSNFYEPGVLLAASLASDSSNIRVVPPSCRACFRQIMVIAFLAMTLCPRASAEEFVFQADRGQFFNLSTFAQLQAVEHGVRIEKVTDGDAITFWSANAPKPTALAPSAGLAVDIAELGERAAFQIMVQFFDANGKSLGGFQNLFPNVRKAGVLKMPKLGDWAAKQGAKDASSLQMLVRILGAASPDNFIVLRRLALTDEVDWRDDIAVSDAGAAPARPPAGLTPVQFHNRSEVMEIEAVDNGFRFGKRGAGDAFTFWSRNGALPTPLGDEDFVALEIAEIGGHGALQVMIQFFDNGRPLGGFHPLVERHNKISTLRIDKLRELAENQRHESANGFRLNLRLLGDASPENHVVITSIASGVSKSINATASKAAAAPSKPEWVDPGIELLEQTRKDVPLRIMALTESGLSVATRGEEVSLWVQNQTSEAVETDVKIDVQDYFGNSESATIPVRVAAGGKVKLNHKVTEKSLGHYTVKAEYLHGNKEVMAQAWFAVIEVVEHKDPASQKTFYHAVCAGSFRNHMEKEGYLKNLKLLGVDMVRIMFYWAAMQRAEDQWNFEEMDKAVGACEEHGIEIMGLLAYSPQWAVPAALRGEDRKVWRSHPPEQKHWEKYVRTVTSRYPQVQMWEIWNEPDLTEFFSGTPADYIRMLQSAYKIINEVNPNALVTTGGFALTSGHGLKKHPTLQRDVMRQAKDSFDILAHHEHAHFRMFRDNLSTLNQWREEAGASQPVFFNETAFGQSDGPDQAQQLFKKHVYLRAFGAIGHAWYQFMDSRAWGLLTEDLEPRATFPAYRNLFNHLGRKRPLSDVKAGYGNHAFLFGESGDSVLAYWSEEADASLQIMAVSVPKSVQTTRIDIMGNTQALDPIEGVLDLPIFPMPALVRFQGNDQQGVKFLAPLVEIKGPVQGFMGGEIGLDVKIANPTGSEQKMRLALGGRKGVDATVEETLQGNESAVKRLTAPMPADLELRFGEQLMLEFDYSVEPAGFKGTVPLAVMIGAYIPLADAADRTPDFTVNSNDGIENLFDYAPGQEDRLWSGPEDLSLKAWLFRDEEKLGLRVEVTDDRHVQTRTGKAIWQGDSVEWAVASAADSSRAWRFGAALGSDGSIQTAQWERPAGNNEDQPLQAKARRDGNVTLYEMTVPLIALGLTLADLQEGIRSSVLVNDDDGHGRESWATPAQGMGSRFEPAKLPLVKFE